MPRNGATPESDQRVALGSAIVPVQFGEQIIVSLLYNHDANPVHHRPDHAIQWMLGLLASQGVGGTEEGLGSAGPEERTYTLGARLLARQDVVVMPGIVLAAICLERFVQPAELTTSITTTFTYPLLVPTKGGVDVRVEAFELPAPNAKAPGCRNILIEAFGPGISGSPVRLLKLEAQIFRAGTSPEQVFQEVVAPQFAELAKLASKIPDMPSISHPSGISSEDRRRYSRIVEPGAKTTRPITESAWQCKIPRVLTEVIDRLRFTEKYQSEVRAYYQGRADEEQRREAIKRLVEKERKYHWVSDEHFNARVEELAGMAQHLYARQHTVFDPRYFREQGAATAPGAQMHFDLSVSEIRLRRGIHRLFTRGRLNDAPVFMGEATIMAQPLVTRELANFLCEVNYSFDTLKLFEYKHAAQ
jgi:hypothetical protein